MAQTEQGCVQQGAAAQVVYGNQVAAMRQGNQVSQWRLVHKANQAKVAAVYAQEQSRLGRDGSFIVLQVGTVGSAHLHQPRAALGHNFGNAKATADFDQLPARNDDFLAFGERSQNQQDCRGVIVDHQCGFRSRQAAKQLLGVDVAGAALSGRQIILQVAVGTGLMNGLPGCLAERSAPQIGVDDHSGRIDDGMQTGTREFGQSLRHHGWDVAARRARPVVQNVFPQRSQRFLDGRHSQVVAVFSQQILDPLFLHQLVHAGQLAQFLACAVGDCIFHGLLKPLHP